MVLIKSLYRTASTASIATLWSSRSAASSHLLRNRFLSTRGFFAVSSSPPSNRTPIYWAELPSAVVHDAKSAISKNTEDEAGQEALKNVFRAAEAVEEFGGILTSIKMEIDDSIGMSGEGVKPLPNDITDALRIAYQRYVDYLDSFEPEEVYLKKKVEMELGTKMIHLKTRCSGLGSEWGKVTVLGTSGLSGSYVEQRA